MLYYYDDIVAEYGKMFADDAARAIAKMRLYSEYLNLENFYGKTPEEFIRIFSNYGRMLYSRETYLWMLAYLLSGKYSFVKDGWYSTEIKSRVDGYHISLTIDEEVYIDNYLRLSKLQEGEPVSGFFKLDEELDVAHWECATYKSLKHLTREKLYIAAEDLFLLYLIENEVNPSYEEWEDFIRRLKFSHQKENFNLSSMLGAIALSTEYGVHRAYWNSHDKEAVMAVYKKLKSSTRRDRRSTNLFVITDSNFGEPPYSVWWRSAR